MAAKPIPEYMKCYMENIGHECFTDYQQLSEKYHNTRQAYHELQYPKRIPPSGRYAPRQDIQADMYRLEEEFKDRALNLACEKYGYKDPGYESYDKDFTDRQQGGPYGKPSRDDFGKTAEDIRAEKAHSAFEKQHPDKAAEKKSNREVIDFYFSGPDQGRSQPAAENRTREAEQKQPDKEQKKEPLSREELVKGFAESRNDISVDKPSDRFMQSLSSEKTEITEPDIADRRDMSIDREDMEMERDF